MTIIEIGNMFTYCKAPRKHCYQKLFLELEGGSVGKVLTAQA